MIANYDTLAENLEAELAAVGVRDFPTAQELQRKRRMIIRRLPAAPPPDARQALTRCSLLNQRIAIELQRVRESILLEMTQVRRGTQAARGYAPVLHQRTRFSASA